MSPALFALLERLHGHVAVLGLAVLVHPLVTLRLRKRVTRGTRLSALLAAVLIAVPTVSGWLLYPSYRQQVKPDLVRHSPLVAQAFERKEHLAFMTVVLVLSGAVILLAARTPASQRGVGSSGARETAFWLLAMGLCCGLLTAGLGLWVAAGAAPGW